jgi:hypothetical protein
MTCYDTVKRSGELTLGKFLKTLWSYSVRHVRNERGSWNTMSEMVVVEGRFYGKVKALFVARYAARRVDICGILRVMHL